MIKQLSIFLHSLISLFRTRRDLAFENLLLRQQLAVMKHGRPRIESSGRALKANKAEITAFVSIQFAALVRVVAAVMVPAWSAHAALCSGLVWTLGFAVFLVAYWPVLTQPRVDGKPG